MNEFFDDARSSIAEISILILYSLLTIANSTISFLIVSIIGWHQEDTTDSNQRRSVSRITFFVALYLVGEHLLDFSLGSQIFVFYALFAWVFLYFNITVTHVIYLAGEKFKPNPLRLISDILISGFYTILAFSLVYRDLGLIDTMNGTSVTEKADFLYFSSVTFSTLGFGDFRPEPDARWAAGLQAILGNLHLGLLAGSAFFMMQSRTSDLE